MVLLAVCGRAKRQEPAPPGVRLELFAVTSDSAVQSIRYVRSEAPVLRDSPDPDVVARGLLGSSATPAMIHSTSWRREKDGSVVLTYLAYCEPGQFHASQSVQLAWSDLASPPATDPLHPRPPQIRQVDVLRHGLRHLSFLVRYARDGRLEAALSPQSRAFFHAMCGQLAGRLESARQFEECVAVGAR